MMVLMVSLQNRSTFITKWTDFAMKVDRFYNESRPILQSFKKWTDFTIRLYKRTTFAIEKLHLKSSSSKSP
jgi:hypothetical protein